MWVRLAMAVLMTPLLFLSHRPSEGQLPPPGCTYNPANQTVICGGDKGGGGQSGTSGNSGSPAPLTGQVWIQIGNLLAASAAHPECWVWMADNVTGDSQATIQQIKQFWAKVEQIFPPCPGVAATTASQWAAEYWTAYWYGRQLPRPQPSVPPGYAITGLPAYLVCGDGALVTVDRGTPLGQLTITARASYDVAWGDGTTSDGLTGPCTRWPDGTVQHTYDNVGTYTVIVDETWHVTWALGGASGAFADVQTTGTLPGLRVRQVQAVVTG